ncbi:hypothetical protein SDC9_177095 [bioreactor metagenome]|uniref:Uncharacterized protein n=1 Tax=bioreactor metagenome TaxID=1076179 RepID=A0A645GUH8_9ZZZZ
MKVPVRVVLSKLDGPCMSRYLAVETVTVAVRVNPPTVAVMVEVPFTPPALEVKLIVAMPLLFTVDVVAERAPIVPSELLQFTVVPFGMTEPPLVTLSVNVVVELAAESVWLEGESVTVGTVTVAYAVWVGAPPAGVLVAVMFAVPLPTAVTRPLEFTVATLVLLEVQPVIDPV